MKLPFGKWRRHARGAAGGRTDIGSPAPVPASRKAKRNRALGQLFGGRRASYLSGNAQVSVELENGRRLYFMAGDQGSFARTEEAVAGAPILTAYRNDWRIQTTAPMSNSQARGFAARETDALERMAAINDSRRGRIYTTGYADLEHRAQRTPILAILDELLDGKTGHFVAGVLFGDHDLAVLYAYNEGVVGAAQMQVSVNPENLQAVVSSFISVSNLPDAAEVIVFEQAEFMQALRARSWEFYPANNGFYGISKEVMPYVALGVSGAAALGTAIYAGYWHYQLQHLKQMRAEHETSRARAIGTLAGELPAVYPTFIERTSVDVLKATAVATALRNQGGVVEAKLSRDAFNFVVRTSFFSMDKAGDNALYRAAFSHQAAPGCSKLAIETTGGMREIKTQYSCPFTGDRLDRFGW